MGEWREMQPRIKPIRKAVFIDEQHVPVELEWDGLDAECTQLLAFVGDNAVGTARMTPGGKIGRMAVLSEWRGRGVGSQLLTRLVNVARAAQLPKVILDAQIEAIPFYSRFGFEVTSGPFLDAGIKHQKMQLTLG